MKAMGTFKNNTKASILSKEISSFHNRGFASAEKVQTVLNFIREETELNHLKNLDQEKISEIIQEIAERVENGEIKAPINVMRFDESLYDLLGDNLQHVTKEREFIFDPGTYGKRSNSSIELPGILVKSMCLTL